MLMISRRTPPKGSQGLSRRWERAHPFLSQHRNFLCHFIKSGLRYRPVGRAFIVVTFKLSRCFHYMILVFDKKFDLSLMLPYKL